MKAIIVAAGRGRRLGRETDGIPKCMVKVGGRPILHRQLDALRAAGVDDVVVVRGYLGDRIAAPGVRFLDNPSWQSNNILASLFHASEEMETGFVFSYSDIVFSHGVAAALMASPADVALIVDRLWRDAYDGRTDHPISEAELARLVDGARGTIVHRVGKRAVPVEEAAGEFIGLARFSAEGARGLRSAWEQALTRGLDAPYGLASSLRVAYLTDALNDLAERGTPLTPVMIDGQWREIDTEQDLARAHALVDGW